MLALNGRGVLMGEHSKCAAHYQGPFLPFKKIRKYKQSVQRVWLSLQKACSPFNPEKRGLKARLEEDLSTWILSALDSGLQAGMGASVNLDFSFSFFQVQLSTYTHKM